jgi:ADP-ribose pyrophosphatase YjhB (NUDIX family)
MTPAAVTDALLHDLVTFSRAEGAGQLAAAAVITLDDRVLFCGRPTADFDHTWDLPGGTVLPGETLTDTLARSLACNYGLSIQQIPAYLGCYQHVLAGEPVRTFVFTAACADPHQICRHASIAHCWADPADLPGQVSHDVAPLIDLAAAARADTVTGACGQRQLTAALRARSQDMYCDQAAAELIISHRTWLTRDDFTGQFIRTQPGPSGDAATAAIDWEQAITALRAGQLPCSGSEAAILLLAASLATTSQVNLRDTITGLDHANLNLITSAVRHANGRH